MVQIGNRSGAGLFVNTYPVQFVPGICHGRPEEFMQEVQVDTNPSFDIRYADDTTIMSTVFEKLQLSTEELQAACRKWGTKINFSKCKCITSSEKNTVLESKELKTVREFCFLGSIVLSTERYIN